MHMPGGTLCGVANPLLLCCTHTPVDDQQAVRGAALDLLADHMVGRRLQYCSRQQAQAQNVNGAAADANLHCSRQQAQAQNVSGAAAADANLHCSRQQAQAQSVGGGAADANLHCSRQQEQEHNVGGAAASDASLTSRHINCNLKQKRQQQQ